jgi:hypothetical protein
MGKGSPQPKTAQMSQSKINVILVVFFDWQGIVHHECYTTWSDDNQTMRWLMQRSSSAVIWQNIRHPLCPIHPIIWT